MSNFSRKIVNLVANKGVFLNSTELLYKVCIVSLGSTNISKGEMAIVNRSNYSEKTPSGFVKDVLESFFMYASEESITIVELGAVGSGQDTIDKKTEKLKKLLDEGQLNAYLICPDKQFQTDSNFLTLVSSYNDVNKNTYFVMGVDYSTNVGSDQTIPKYNNFKSAIFILEQLDNNVSAVGTFAGLYVNSFKISTNNTMKPFDYKFINSNIKDITQTQADAMDQKNVIYFSSLIGKPTFYKVICQDGTPFSYYIAYDNLSIRLTDTITSTIINNSNKQIGAIEFTNSGILILKSVIESELLNCKELKLISEFGASYDSASNQIKELNSIGYIPFIDYLKSNKTEYEQDTYNGFSIELRIMKFILKLNITSNLY